MPNTLRLNTGSRNARVDAHCALLNGGTREIRTGSRPAAVTDSPTGTLLVTFTFGNPAFGAASGGSATSNAIANATAVGTGDAGWFRDRTSGNQGYNP